MVRQPGWCYPLEMLGPTVLAVLFTAAPVVGYAKLNSGLQMYFEKHGTSGSPVLLLHGGLGNIDTSWSKVLPMLSKGHVVIAPEQQGHGHTADLDRPLSYEQMAEDTAELLAQEKLQGVDVIGWSDGGNVALILALKHPDLVRKLMVTGANWRADGMEEKGVAWLTRVKVEEWPAEDLVEWKKGNHDPADWPSFLGKIKKLWLGMARPMKELEQIRAPVLVMAGDKDVIKLDHTLELHRRLRGSQLAILPGTPHKTPLARPEWFSAMALSFLDAPMPSPGK